MGIGFSLKEKNTVSIVLFFPLELWQQIPELCHFTLVKLLERKNYEFFITLLKERYIFKKVFV